MLTFHILNVYVDKTQPRQFKFTFKTLSAWVNYYYSILQTHHAHTHTFVAVRVIAIRWVGRPNVMARSASDNAGRWPLK